MTHKPHTSREPDPLAIPEELRKPRSSMHKPEPEAGMWGMAKAWGIALEFIFTIVAGGLLGYGYDYWRKTGQTGIMVGLAVGFVLAFVQIVRGTMKQEREEQARRKGGGKQ